MYILYKEYNKKFVKVINFVKDKSAIKNNKWILAQGDVCKKLRLLSPVNEILMRVQILKFEIVTIEQLNLGYFEFNSLSEANRKFFLNNFRSDVYNSIKKEAQKVIAGPILIKTSDNIERLYTYTLKDQISLLNLLNSTKANQKVYYSDITETMNLYSKADLKLIHTTLENNRRYVLAYLNAFKKYLNTLTYSNYLENDLLYYGYMNDFIKKETEIVYETNKL